MALAFYDDLGGIYSDTDNGLAYSRKALEAAQNMRKRFGDEGIDFDDIALPAMNLAQMLVEKGKQDEARKYFRIAHEANDKDFADYPDNTDTLKRRTKILLGEAEVEEKLGNLKQAVTLLELRLETLIAMNEKGIGNKRDIRKAEKDIADRTAQLRAKEAAGKPK